MRPVANVVMDVDAVSWGCECAGAANAMVGVDAVFTPTRPAGTPEW